MTVHFVISKEYSDNKIGTCEHVNNCQLMKDEYTLHMNRIVNKPFCQSVTAGSLVVKVSLNKHSLFIIPLENFDLYVMNLVLRLFATEYSYIDWVKIERCRAAVYFLEIMPLWVISMLLHRQR
jgi:hypothetical protein